MSKAPVTPRSTATSVVPPPAAAIPASATKRCDEAFKRQAVEHWLRSGQRGAQIARDLGVSYPSLKDWKHRYHGDVTPVRADLAGPTSLSRTASSRPSWPACASSVTC